MTLQDSACSQARDTPPSRLFLRVFAFFAPQQLDELEALVGATKFKELTGMTPPSKVGVVMADGR